MAEGVAEPVSSFHFQRRVEFADTDLGGLVHFSRFFVFMEAAEHAFLRSLGSSVHLEIDGRRAGWPRLAAKAEYLSPARFEDVLDIDLAVRRKGRTSMTYGFAISTRGRPVARGELSTVCCILDDPAGLRPVPIPEELARRLQQAAPEEP